ncbi:MAG: hypothetical protein AB1405_06215 [Bdellovibrionota bacterium]
MRRKLLAALVLAAYLAPATVRAEPYLAIREGLKCSQCHANVTGGGKRTDYGSIYANTSLPMMYFAPWKKMKEEGKQSPLSGFVTGRVTDYLSLGMDLRTSNTTALVPAGPFSPKTEANEFAVDEANLYVEGELIPQHLVLYLDAQFAPGSPKAREVFGMWKGLPWDSYVKAGRFFVPYGLRLQDDSAVIRRQTGFTFQASDVGVEVGFEPGPFSMSVSVTNGTTTGGDDNVDKQFSTVFSWNAKCWRIGGSASFNDTPSGSRSVHGGFAGATLGRFTGFAELDHIMDDFGATEVDGLAILAELNVLVVKGFNAKFTYEYFDPDMDLSENQRLRWSAVLEPFITQFLQARLGGRIADAPPQLPAERAEEIFVEIHVFL